MIKNQSIPNILRDNEIINLNYIINNKENNNSKINVEINYLENEEKIEKKYEIIPYYLTEGEELSKLIINNYLKNDNLEKDEIKLELKYQIFGKNTSFFAEIELSDKVTEEMKEKILGNKGNNQIEINMPKNTINFGNMGMNNYLKRESPLLYHGTMVGGIDFIAPSLHFGKKDSPSYMNMGMKNSYSMMGMGNNQKMGMMNSSPPISMPMKNSPLPRNMEFESCPQISSMVKNNNKIDDVISYGSEIKDIQETINTNKKDDIIKIINTQDFINGFWEINEYTNIIKEKFKEEYNLLKGIKNKNITDKVVITFLIIYFIEKEHPELVDELLMIIKKAKIFILNETKETYAVIIKEISIT